MVNRVYIIYDGEILVTGKPNEIIDNTNVRDVYLGKNFY